ncbi:MAG TPA: hypothetical protein VFI25_04280 [Planctomycetota bacterium]|jgi:hypothetical protein|nr:hypothetical protein [Planctomycetota bacterium]
MGARRDKAFSQMVRFDGADGIVHGNFFRGRFRTDGPRLRLEKPVSDWARLRVEVDGPGGVYSISLDGRPIGGPYPLAYRSGFAGLQASNGVVRFDDVRIPRAEPEPPTLRWPRAVASLGEDFLVASPDAGTLLRVQPSGACGALAPALAAHPRAVAVSGGRTIAVAEPDSLLLLDSAGLRRLAGEPWGFRGPSDLAFLPDGSLLVSDTGNHRIVLLSSKGEFLASAGGRGAGPSQLDRPAGIDATAGGRILLADSGNARVQELERAGNALAFVRAYPLGVAPRDVLALPDGSFLASVPEKILRLDSDGALLRSFEGGRCGPIEPYGLASGGGLVVAVDRVGDRLLLLDSEPGSDEPVASYAESGAVRIEWKTPFPAPTDLRYEKAGREGLAPAGHYAGEGSNASPTTRHLVRLAGLEPLARYRARIRAPLPTIPPAGEETTIEFLAPPAAGSWMFARLPVLVLFLPNVVETAKGADALPSPPPLPPEAVEAVRREIRNGVLFYWRNSGMRLLVDAEVLVVEDFLPPGALAENRQANGTPSASEIAKVATRAGRSLERYAGVCLIQGLRAWDGGTHEYRLVGGASGLTAPLPGGPGLSWWFAPPGPGGNAWLFVHEFHHQIASLFEAAGIPDYPSNHFSPTTNSAARFGEHYDGNAWILRGRPAAQWFALRGTSAATTADRDEDGLPDEDPRLPLDEKRFGSDPAKPDTDGDGASDLAEAMFVRGSEAGGAGESWASGAPRPDPRKPDADGDGLPDGADPYPLYALPASIPASTVALDGKIGANEYARVVAMEDEDLRAAVHAAYDAGALRLAFELDRPAKVEVRLDARDDGWYVGRDNWIVAVDPSAPGAPVSVSILDAAEPGRWPFEDRDLVKSEEIARAVSRTEGGGLALELALPRNATAGLLPDPGRRIAIRFLFSTAAAEAKGRGRVTPFEPHALVSLPLGPAGEAPR